MLPKIEFTDSFLSDFVDRLYVKLSPFSKREKEKISQRSRG